MQNIKVMETARKFLIDIMGEDNFKKLLADEKLEIVHKNKEEETVYELYIDGKIINKTIGGKYCIDGGDIVNLPLHDQIAIKYAYLKNDIARVESIANKTGIDGRSIFRVERPNIESPIQRSNVDIAGLAPRPDIGDIGVIQRRNIGYIGSSGSSPGPPVVPNENVIRETDKFLYVINAYGGEVKIAKRNPDMR